MFLKVKCTNNIYIYMVLIPPLHTHTHTHTNLYTQTPTHTRIYIIFFSLHKTSWTSIETRKRRSSLFSQPSPLTPHPPATKHSSVLFSSWSKKEKKKNLPLPPSFPTKIFMFSYNILFFNINLNRYDTRNMLFVVVLLYFFFSWKMGFSRVWKIQWWKYQQQNVHLTREWVSEKENQ